MNDEGLTYLEEITLSHFCVKHEEKLHQIKGLKGGQPYSTKAFCKTCFDEKEGPNGIL